MGLRALKRFRTKGLLLEIVIWLVRSYLRFTMATVRIEVIAPPERAMALKGEFACVYAIWHGRFMGAVKDVQDGAKIVGIASRSADGEIGVRIIQPFGFDVIRGSSSDPRRPGKDRGGALAFATAVDHYSKKDGAVIGLTPDGPKGPRGRCKAGVAAISARAGVPVIPVTFSARRVLAFKSWDRMILPTPWTKMVLMWGEPISPPPNESRSAVEAHRQRIEEELIALTREADQRVGRTPFEPADPEPVKALA